MAAVYLTASLALWMAVPLMLAMRRVARADV